MFGPSTVIQTEMSIAFRVEVKIYLEVSPLMELFLLRKAALKHCKSLT